MKANFSKSKTLRQNEGDQSRDLGLFEEDKDNLSALRRKESIVSRNSSNNVNEVKVEKGKYKLMFKYNDPLLFWWDSFVMLVVIYNCITLSYFIGFNPDFTSHGAYILFDNLINLIYVIDIIQSFITTYLDENGDEVTSYKLIAIQYLKGRFFIDVVSTIPWNYFGGSDILPVLGLLKLTRLGRISIIISRLSINETYKAMLKIVQLTFYLYLVNHILGCIWFWIVNQNKLWAPPFDWVVLPAINTNLYSYGTSYEYWSCFYYAILIIAGNEIGPRTNFEFVFISIMLIVGTFIKGSIFGEMANLTTIMTEKQVKFQSQVDSANTAMKNLDISLDVQQQVRDYFLFTQITLDEQEELKKFIDMLSPSLKLEITIHIFSQELKKKLLKDQPKVNEIVRLIVTKLNFVLSVPEEILLNQDDESTDMFFIAKGECGVNVLDNKKNENIDYKILKPGHYFGEISLLYGCRRTATVYSRNYSTLGRISRESIMEIQSDNPAFMLKVKQRVLEYSDPNKTFLMQTLNKIEFLNGIDEEILTEILYSFRKTNYKGGSTILKVDQNADKFMVVYDGIVEFYTHFENFEFVLENLYSGSIFNYRTFFMEDLMYVNVRCKVNTALLEISKDTIESIMEKHDHFKRKMLSYQNQILKQEKTYPLDYLVEVPDEFKSK